MALPWAKCVGSELWWRCGRDWATIAPLPRLFSTSRVNYLPEDSGKTWVRRHNELRRLRMASDPDYRERVVKQNHEWRARKWRENEEWRASRIARVEASVESMRLNPEDWERYKERQRVWWHAKKDDPEHFQRFQLGKWVRRSARARNKFTWKTHHPVVYPDKVEHDCTGCGYTKTGGRKLWWRHLADPTKYDCHPCFAADWSRATPIGYENHDFNKGVPKRH